jgi:hypothetical protein
LWSSMKTTPIKNALGSAVWPEWLWHGFLRALSLHSTFLNTHCIPVYLYILSVYVYVYVYNEDNDDSFLYLSIHLAGLKNTCSEERQTPLRSTESSMT